MTTGELLVELSGLPTGAAMEHLMAIEAGGGAGGTTIIDSFTATLEADVSVDLEDETVSVTIEDDYDGSVDSGDIIGTVSGDIDVDLECP